MSAAAPNASIVARWPDFHAFLKALEPMTEDDLRDDMARITDEQRAVLARGPIGYRWSCGICNGLDVDRVYGNGYDASDPAQRVAGYHEVPKLYVKRNDQLHYGPLANEIYERCIATYRAAGWDGDAQEPNA